MKLCLMLDSKEYVREGYTNIDPFAPTEDKLRVRHDIKQLSLADDGEVEEILALDVISYFSLQASNVILYGKQDKPWHIRRNIMSLEDMTRLLEAYGLNILQKKIEAGTAFIKAQRP
jgi:hypothetical protein